MAYEKQTWEDRQVENPMTFTITNHLDGTITLNPTPGQILNQGTLIDSQKMEHIEEGIYDNNLGIIPIGTILEFAGTLSPDNFLLCDGSSYLKTDYPDLFSTIGTVYGSVDDTHFNVPDKRGNVGVGYKSEDTLFGKLGKTLGERAVQLILDNLPENVYNDTPNPRFFDNQGYGLWVNNRIPGGGNVPHNNIQPSIVLNYIIRAN